MSRKPVLTLALFSVLSGPFAFAQQPDANPAPMPPPPGGKMQMPGPPKQKTVRDVHVITMDGMRDARIAPPGLWWRNPDIIQKLNITPDQQKRMDDIFQQSRIQLIDLRAAVEKQEVLLEPMLDANPPDTNKILAQIDRTAQARAELEKANAKMLLGIRTVLTPDQWTKLQTEERGNRRMMLRFKPKDGPDGPDGMLLPPPGEPRENRLYRVGPNGDVTTLELPPAD
jgi:Spy/CpxP family protein refolding chaperone